MAWIFGTSFDKMLTADLPKFFQLAGANASIDATGGENGTPGFKSSNGQHYIGRGVNPTDPTTNISGFHIKWPNPLPAATAGFFGLWDSVVGRGSVMIMTNSNGSVSIYAITNNSTYLAASLLSPVATSPAGIIIPQTLHHIQVKSFLNASSGTVEVKVDGATVVSYTGNTVNPTGGASARYNMVILGGANGIIFDNFWTCDASGPRCNDFLGPLIGECQTPAANGNTVTFTPSSGSNHAAMVDDPTPDGDTTVVTGTSVGNKDTYTLGALSRIGSGIKAVQVVTIAKADAAGTRAIEHVTRSGGTDYTSADFYLSSSYAAQVSAREIDPATGIEWSVSGANAQEVGQTVSV